MKLFTFNSTFMIPRDGVVYMIHPGTGTSRAYTAVEVSLSRGRLCICFAIKIYPNGDLPLTKIGGGSSIRPPKNPAKRPAHTCSCRILPLEVLGRPREAATKIPTNENKRCASLSIYLHRFAKEHIRTTDVSSRLVEA